MERPSTVLGLVLSGVVAARRRHGGRVVGGAKIQVGLIGVFNSGAVVDLVTRVFELNWRAWAGPRVMPWLATRYVQ